MAKHPKQHTNDKHIRELNVFLFKMLVTWVKKFACSMFLHTVGHWFVPFLELAQWCLIRENTSLSRKSAATTSTSLIPVTYLFWAIYYIQRNHCALIATKSNSAFRRQKNRIEGFLLIGHDSRHKQWSNLHVFILDNRTLQLYYSSSNKPNSAGLVQLELSFPAYKSSQILLNWALQWQPARGPKATYNLHKMEQSEAALSVNMEG